MSEIASRIEQGTHHFPIRVYYEDTDAVGIVYYANYLKYAERARTEMLRLVDFSQSKAAGTYGTVFAVRDCRIDFRHPAHLDDLVEVRSRLVELAAATLSAVQTVWRGGEELVRLDIRIACLRRDGRPTRIPAPLRRALQVYLQPQEQG